MFRTALLLLAIPTVALADPPEAEALAGAGQDRPSAPIINGDDADTDDYPMTGGMLFDGDITSDWGDFHYRAFMCSSTLIAPDVVLLAAHCIDSDALTYGYGTVENEDVRWTRQADLTDWDGSDENVPWPDDAVAAWDWVHHPDWDMNGLQMELAENRDIALLFLDEPVLDVPFAYLPTPDEATQLEAGNEVVVVGWGQQVATSGWESPPPGTYAIKQWGTSYISQLADYEFQVGADEADVRKCHGDSGGPSFMDVETESPEKMRLVGVTSHAYDESDCNETGGVDTRVDWYLEWIDQEMTSRCEDGSRVWCDVPGIIPPPEPEPEPIDDSGDDEGRAKACGCAVDGGVATGTLPLLLGLLLVRRRRA